ncbi:MAG TPA: hypothetical protein VFA76_04385 [Terriglobales bacterium]|nr:hypothetical protein [Terriglobales bacterium]
MAHLLFHVHYRRPALDQQRAERVPEIVKPDLPKPSLRENWPKIAMVEVVGIEDRALRRCEDQIVRNVMLTLQERLQKVLISPFNQRPPQVAGQVNTSALLALRCGVLAAHIVVPNDDVAIRILLVFPELDVSPPHGNQFAATQTCSQCHQKERVILRANLSRCLEKLLGFSRRQRDSLDLRGLRGPRETTEARSGIHFDDTRLHRLVEYPPDHT